MKKNAAPTARRSRSEAILPASFYDRETEQVSRDLLGCVLECSSPLGKAAGVIVETEAYIGEHDPACHAAAGRTKRTDPLYGRPGIAYVYFIYGMYWCVNAVTRAEGLPSAVLIRAVEPLSGLELMRARRPRVSADRNLTNGPGKLCIALGIGPEHNGASLQRGGLMIRAGERVPDRDVVIAPRIGIKKAADWPLRWYIRNNAFVSRP